MSVYREKDSGRRQRARVINTIAKSASQRISPLGTLKQRMLPIRADLLREWQRNTGQKQRAIALN